MGQNRALEIKEFCQSLQVCPDGCTCLPTIRDLDPGSVSVCFLGLDGYLMIPAGTSLRLLIKEIFVENSDEGQWSQSRHLFRFLSEFLFSLLPYSFSVNQVISKWFRTVKGQKDGPVLPAD